MATTVSTVDLAVYSNEDLIRDFSVRARDPSLPASVITPTLAQTVPFDLTGGTLHSSVKDNRGSTLVTLSSDTTGIDITNPAQGLFTLTIPHDTLRTWVGRVMVYDILFIASDSSRHRLWGGALVVNQGTST